MLKFQPLKQAFILLLASLHFRKILFVCQIWKYDCVITPPIFIFGFLRVYDQSLLKLNHLQYCLKISSLNLTKMTAKQNYLLQLYFTFKLSISYFLLPIFSFHPKLSNKLIFCHLKYLLKQTFRFHLSFIILVSLSSYHQFLAILWFSQKRMVQAMFMTFLVKK